MSVSRFGRRCWPVSSPGTTMTWNPPTRTTCRAVVLPLLCALWLAPAHAAPPNVVVILTDDQGYGDLSAHGNPILKTPNLDRLHDESVRLTDFHVASVCTPTRGELMTSLYALRNKAGMVPAGRNLMRRDIPTMPEVFAANGYETGLFGKWHLGDTYPHRPMDRGFKRAVWHKGWGLASEIEYDNDYYYTLYLDQLETKYSDRFCANLWFDKAMEWIGEQAQAGRPFFTYLALNTPHSPFHSLPKEFALYGDRVEDPATAHFFGLIQNIDQNFARLDRRLGELGIKDDTIVVLMNDNGTSKGDQVFNAGMRGKKGSNYEGGHRALCFIRWPGGDLGKPRGIDYNTHVTDILPTMADLAGSSLPENASFDGDSLKDVLMGKTGRDRKIIVQYGGRIRPQKYDRGCVMWNKWRLVGREELYDLKRDPGQKENLAKRRAEILQTLQAFYDDYWTSIEASVSEVEPLLIQADPEEFTDLTSNNWIEVDCDNRSRVAATCEPAQGGMWRVEAESTGQYVVELSRWPFHLERGLTERGPGATIGGSLIDPGLALAIATARLSVDGQAPIGADAAKNASAVSFDVFLEEGRHTVKGWFKGTTGNDLSGAYYGRIRAKLSAPV